MTLPETAYAAPPPTTARARAELERATRQQVAEQLRLAICLTRDPDHEADLRQHLHVVQFQLRDARARARR
jgi:hypothetical protein